MVYLGLHIANVRVELGKVVLCVLRTGHSKPIASRVWLFGLLRILVHFLPNGLRIRNSILLFGGWLLLLHLIRLSVGLGRIKLLKLSQVSLVLGFEVA